MGATQVGTMRRGSAPVAPSLRGMAVLGGSSSVAGCGDRRPQPTAPVRHKLIERARIVVGHAARKNLLLPGVGRNFKALQLAQRLDAARARQPVAFAARRAASAAASCMNCAGVTGSTCLRSVADGEVMNAREQAALAPFDVGQLGSHPVANRWRRGRGTRAQSGEVAAEDRAGGFQT